MLKDQLFTIEETKLTEEKNIQFLLNLNAEHKIFRGHFPNQPVVPGVVSMQIIKESAENFLGKKLQLQKAANVKFPAVLIPENNKQLQALLKIKKPAADIYKIQAQLYSEEEIFMKIQAQYIEKCPQSGNSLSR